jgi:uncharacterized protein (DUF2236 family)
MVESRSWWPRRNDAGPLPEARAGRRGLSAARRTPLLAAIGLDLPPLEVGLAGDPGLFGARSEVWRVGRERVLLAGGASALLLQIAHPLVAAGVTEHSDFPRRAFDRLRSTLDATLRITFGDREQAERTAEGVRATHAAVRGTLTRSTGAFPAGTAYDAGDPELALWVHATLVMTALDTYDRLVRPLPAAERARYFEETKPFGAMFGADDRVMPPTYDAFLGYFRTMVGGGSLVAGPQARDLARDILSPPLPVPILPARPVNRIITAGLLPEPVRETFGLRWRPRDRSAFLAVASASRAALPLAPAPLRYWPHYRSAIRRLRR